jgi:predicted DNA-binding protein
VLTSPDGPVFSDRDRWEGAFDDALVHVQWDPERSLRGAALHHYSIQVGLSRDIIREFVDEWIVELEDFSSTVAKLRSLLRSGEFKKAQRLLPRTKLYAPPEESIDRIFFGHR